MSWITLYGTTSIIIIYVRDHAEGFLRLTQIYLRSSLLFTSKVTGKFRMQRGDDQKYVYFHRLSCQKKKKSVIKMIQRRFFFWMFT